MYRWEYEASPGAVRELLKGGGEFNPPDRILQDLTEVQATAAPPGMPHSIAQILSHTHFYQEKTLAHLRGDDRPGAAHLDATFASIQPGSWRQLVADFLAG